MRSALVTGCSVGLGRATALCLADRGWRVFAGVRSPADAHALEEAAAGRDLVPVILDVLEPETIAAAKEKILSSGDLHALVNNAGLVVNQPVEFASEQDCAYQFGVNLFGPVRLIQAFLPLLRETRGRIVNVTSGVTKVTQPFSGLYAASKAALDQLSLSLRMEVEADGVSVTLVDPGLMRTRMTEGGLEASEASMSTWSEVARKRYGDANRENTAKVAQGMSGAKSPEEVAALIARALEREKPIDVVLAGADAKAADILNRLLPWRTKQSLLSRLIFRS